MALSFALSETRPGDEAHLRTLYAAAFPQEDLCPLVEALLATLTDSTDADELAQNWARLSTHFDTLFTTEASIDALKQTILQLAVMGKLVPQDPSDEPASQLLKRIAVEKARLVAEECGFVRQLLLEPAERFDERAAPGQSFLDQRVSLALAHLSSAP